MNDFRGLAKILSLYDPLEVMKMSLWEERRIYALQVKDECKRRAAVLLPIVLQSIMESEMIDGVGNIKEVKEKDWERLKSLSEDIVKKMVRVIDSMTAISLNKGEVDIDSAPIFRKAIEKRLLPDFVTKESLERDIWQLRSLFEEIPDFEERMGCDYISFVLNVQNIARTGLNGIDDLIRDVALYKEEYSLREAQMRSSGELDGLSENQVFDKITKKNHWEGRAAELSEKRDGFSMFMPETSSSLPLSSYAQYSVKASSLNLDAFLSRGFWPAVRYPFFAYKGKVYTFVGKHLPFFLSLTSFVDRFLASSRDVLSIFFLSDCDTYTYDGNKIEISILPSVLDINPVVYPNSLKDILRRRKIESSVQRKLGHKKLVVDPDMEKDMEEKEDVMYISSSFLSRATVDKNTKRELLSSLLGDLDLPEEDSVFVDPDDYYDSSDNVTDDEVDEKSSYDYEYEYNDVDEDEMARELDDRYDNITLVEYEKTTPTEEEKNSLIDRYSLTEELIRKSEEEEKIETEIEDELDDDIFDDSDEEDRLDDIGVSDGDSEYYEEVEASDEYIEEKTQDDDGQLDFFSLLDEEDPEEIEFDNELDKEDEESFEEEEKRELILDSNILLPSDSEISGDEEIIEEIADSPVEPESPQEIEKEENTIQNNSEKTEDETIDTSSENEVSDSSDDSVALEDSSERVMEETETSKEEDLPENVVSEVVPLEIDKTDEEVEADIPKKTLTGNDGLLDFDEKDTERKEVSEETEDPLDNFSEERDEEDKEKSEDNSFIFDDSDDSQSLPLAEAEDNSKPSMSFTDNLFAALGLEEDEETESDEEYKGGEETDSAPLVEESKEEPEITVNEELEEIEENEDEEEKDDVELPGIIKAIYKALGASSAFGEFIKLSDKDTLSDLDDVIENCWNRQQMEGKDKMFNISDYSLSIILARDSVRDDLRLSELLNNAGGVMYSRDCDSWNAVIVYIDSDHVVEKALEKTIKRESFSPSDWKRVTYIGEQMKKR